MSPGGEFEPQVGGSAGRSVRSWSWFAGAMLLGSLVWWCAMPRRRGDAPEPPVASTLSAEARAEQDAWLAAVLPASRGLDPEAVPRQRLDAVLVRAPHDDVLRWFRVRGSVVADGVDGELVELGAGNALVIRLAGQGWSVVLERGEHGDWPAAMSKGLHALVLVVRRFDAGPFGYELHDDGVVVERLTGTEPPAFRSTRRAAPASLDDDAAILDALLRELDAFVPALDFDECCRPLDRYGPRSPSRIASPECAQDLGSGPVTRQFTFARCSWITW